MNYPIEVIGIPELADIGLSHSMLGTLCLGFYAGMIGSGIVGNLNGKRIISNLYCLHIGESGSSKSLAYNVFAKHVKRIQQNFLREQKRYIDNAISQLKVLKEGDNAKELNNRIDLKDEIFTHPDWGEMLPNKLKKIYVSVGTIEGLISNIQYYPYGTLIGYDEAYKFFKDMGRYTKGNSSDIQFYTSAFDGEPFYEVKKHDKEYILPDNIYLSFVGIMNRDQFAKVYAKYDDDGFKERFLYSYEPYKGIVILPASDIHLDKISIDFERLFALRNVQRIIPIPRIIDDAIIDFIKYNDSIANPIWRKYLPKVRTIMERLVLILSVIRNCEVNTKLVDDVIKLMEYYICIYQELFKYEEEDPISKLTEKSKKMYEMLPDKFKFSDATKINNMHKIFGSKNSLVKLLNNSELFIKENGIYLKRESLI